VYQQLSDQRVKLQGPDLRLGTPANLRSVSRFKASTLLLSIRTRRDTQSLDTPAFRRLSEGIAT